MRYPHSLRQARRPAREEQANDAILQLCLVRNTPPVKLLIRYRHLGAGSRLPEFQVLGPAIHENVPRCQPDFVRRGERGLFEVGRAYDDLGFGLSQLVRELVWRGGGTGGCEDAAGGDGGVEHHRDHKIACRYVEHDVFVWAIGSYPILISKHMGGFLRQLQEFRLGEVV